MSLEGQVALGLLSGTVQGLITSMVALGLSMTFGVMRVVNLLHGEFFTLGAVLTWVLVSTFDSYALALVAAPLIVAGIAKAVNDQVLDKLDYAPEATILATLALMLTFQQATLYLFGPSAKAVRSPIHFTLTLPWFGFSGYRILVAVVAIVFGVSLWIAVRETRLGLFMRAVQEDREMAEVLGVDTDRVYLLVFSGGAALAALAGVLVVPVQQAHYLMGVDALLTSFVVVVIGGLGDVAGTLIASLLVGLLDGLLAVFVTPTFAQIAALALVGVVLLARPRGLLGRRRES